MANLKVGIRVMPRPEVLDTQGRAVHQTLSTMNLAVDSVRVGKFVEIELPVSQLGDVSSEQAAIEKVKTIAKEVLCNPLIEVFYIVKNGETINKKKKLE